MKASEYKEIVLTHLQYIKEKVDANHDHLQTLNGRVGRNEKIISWIIGVGSSLVFIITCLVTYLGTK
tara:strand:- start:896 stop:1096 length:201 start_codon:yes stop_codon:yes gene_type:complete